MATEQNRRRQRPL